MQFVVPQFIEVESKVIGPISVRQFIILLVTAGLVYVEFELFTFWIFAILGLITLALGGIIAFAKINSQPFHIFALSVIQTMRRPNLALWRRDVTEFREVKKSGKKDKKDDKNNRSFQPKGNLTPSDIAELSLIVDTGGKYTPANMPTVEPAPPNDNSKNPV